VSPSLLLKPMIPRHTLAQKPPGALGLQHPVKPTPKHLLLQPPLQIDKRPQLKIHGLDDSPTSLRGKGLPHRDRNITVQLVRPAKLLLKQQVRFNIPGGV